MSEPLLDLRNVRKDFPVRGSVPFSKPTMLRAVDDVSLTINRGEAFGLVGESGSGKSTLGHMVLDLLQPTAGEIRFEGATISGLSKSERRPYRRRIQLVFQDPYSSLDPTQSVGSMIREILAVHRLAEGDVREKRVAELLDQVGLPASAARRYPHEFSGGQRQRIVIAKALASEPEFIVADEPVSALDVSIQAQIVQLIARLQRDLGLTLLLVAHDLGLIQHMSDRVGVLYLGKLVEVAPTRQIFATPRHPYTEMLLSAAPSIEGRDPAKRILPKGEIPSPLSPPSGCVFRTRCRYAIDACAATVPQLETVGPGHMKACIRNDILGGSDA